MDVTIGFSVVVSFLVVASAVEDAGTVGLLLSDVAFEVGSFLVVVLSFLVADVLSAVVVVMSLFSVRFWVAFEK